MFQLVLDVIITFMNLSINALLQYFLFNINVRFVTRLTSFQRSVESKR